MNSVCSFRTLRAQSQVELGRPAQAETELDRLEGVTMKDETRVVLRMTRIMWIQATGDPVRARRLSDGSGPLVRSLGGFAPAYLGPSRLAMAAEIAWAEGDHERAWRDAGRSWWSSLPARPGEEKGPPGRGRSPLRYGAGRPTRPRERRSW